MTTVSVDGRHVWQPSTRERLAYRLAGAVLIVALAFMIQLLVWLAFPNGGFFEVVIQTPPTATAGTLLRYQVNYCHGLNQSQVLVNRELELEDHGTNIPLPGLAYSTEQNCETVNRAVGIPSYTPAGPYRLKITTEIQVNPLRRVRQEWRTDVFQVKTDPNSGAWIK